MKATVLYYTSNTEEERFESNIRKSLLSSIGDLPLVSVSQKPLPGFGKNICVGEHDNCYANEFRQIQVGLKEVKTLYVLTAEADFLYPPEYFKFSPGDDDCYRYHDVWVHSGDKYFYKGSSNGAQMIKTEIISRDLDKAFKGQKEWFSAKDKISITRYKTNIKKWSSKNPAITFKTGNGISNHTQVSKRVSPRQELPYWGNAINLKKEMYEKNE